MLHFHPLHPCVNADPTAQLPGDKAEGEKGGEAENSLEEQSSSWEKQELGLVGLELAEWAQSRVAEWSWAA